MILPGIVEQQYYSTQCRANMLTQDELKCVRVYSYLQRQLAPKRQEQKRSNWIERRMEKLENKTANKKQ